MTIQQSAYVNLHSFAAVLAAMVLAGVAQADTKTWNGSTSVSWTNALNWTGGAPGDGDDVLIPSGTANQANLPAGTWPASGRYGAFTVNNGATVICLGDMTVTNEASGGGVVGDGTIHGIGVTILCTDATILGTLSANGMGFQSGGPGTGLHDRFRPGSYGGRGSGIIPNKTYGNVEEPTALGSAGFSQSSPGRAAGGGAIKIDATGAITVDGTVSANGNVDIWYSGGSGGSVWLVSDTLAGSGNIHALGGGNVNPITGAGGGRIALDYAASTFIGRISAAGGKSLTPASIDLLADGQAGSLWEPNRAWPTTGPVLVRDSYRYYFPGTNTFYAWDLVVSNAWFELHDGRAVLTSLTLVDGVFRFDDASRPFDGDSNMEELILGGHILLTNTTRYSELHLPAGDYELESLTVHANGTVLAGGRPAATNAASGGTGASPHGAGVSIRADDISVAANGSISASGFGFSKQLGNAGPSGGPSHGGTGVSGNPYGSLTRPSALGGGANTTATALRGGGAIKLVVSNRLDMNGTVQANGGWAGGYGTAGGSVWIVANELSGAGAIRADASKYENWSGDRGSGGRIAIDTLNSTFSGSMSVRQGYYGASIYSDVARTGTVFLCQSLVFGSSTPDSNGPALDAVYGVSGSDVAVTRTVTKWGIVIEWTDSSARGDGTALANTATYTLTGLSASRYTVSTNGVHMAAIVPVDGRLEIANVPLTPSVSVRVEGPSGTSITIR